MSEEIQNQEPVQLEMTEEQKQQWKRDQFLTVKKFLAERGLLPESVIDANCYFYPPLIALFNLKLQNGKKCWAIAGRLPTDVVDFNAAKDAGSALKYFSYQWQIKADEILSTGTRDTVQLSFANLLINRAHGLYEFAEKDPVLASAQA